MCHNSVIEKEQIEKCLKNGMPKKVIKTVKYTMRKRAANEEINNKLQQQQATTYKNTSNKSNSRQQINPEKSRGFVFKCPFGHGKFTTPAATVYVSPLAQPPTTTNTSLINSKFDFSNNSNKNNKLYKRVPQITADKSAAANVDSTSTNLSGHFDDVNKKLLLSTEKIYNDDILAKSTQLTREFTYKMQQAMRRLQSSKINTLLTKTAQPAHLVGISILTFVLVTFWPEFIHDGQHSANLQQHTTPVPIQEILAKNNHMLPLIAYLGAFSTHFGAQIWMTFVSGLSLYFSLPRHIFGQCQQILFPKYFAMNAVLSFIMLILYVKYFVNTWTLTKCMQLGLLSMTGAIELFIRLYLAPPLLRLMQEKYKIEGTIGSGKEIGSLVQGDLIQCPHYQRIHNTFRRIHMMAAIGNVITIAGSCLQLYNIADQLQISLVH